MDFFCLPRYIVPNTYNCLNKILSIFSQVANFQVIDKVIIQNIFNFRLISLQKFFVVEFLCDFDMAHYPFDSQNCFAEIEIANGGEFIELITGGLISESFSLWLKSS